MNREDIDNDVIDLGAVSTETKGVFVGIDDSEAGLQPRTGLSDD